ncbi:hypothetical protein CFC21_074299 [Triticum aestivum]|uniref:Uncharacterized protein n=2 Tax=Triticum aestivum TaxID=4565 RepID=A0A9R1HNY4_WHEAT|nr:uncharacterized protein LOC123113875 [Triticum aestivum]KAF7068558.1 hypothetical protein CFC21_074299 [Triticum aestivum]
MALCFHLTTGPSNPAVKRMQAQVNPLTAQAIWILGCFFLGGSLLVKLNPSHPEPLPCSPPLPRSTHTRANPSHRRRRPRRSPKNPKPQGMAHQGQQRRQGAAPRVPLVPRPRQAPLVPPLLQAPLVPPPVQGPLVPPPAQVARRAITHADVVDAFEVVKCDWAPVRAGVPEIENTFYEFDKRGDDTKNRGGNLIKRHLFNRRNHVGNKRREICHYLPAYKKYAILLKKLSNDLQGLEHRLDKKLLDYNQYMPEAPLTNPDHFSRYPELLKPATKGKKATKK